MESRSRPAPLAPAPPGYGSGRNSARSTPVMPFSCQTCARRKVKCDKAAPACSRCRKSALNCAYEAPGPRRRKVSSHLLEKLDRYERILREHGLLETDPASTEQPVEEPVSLLWDEPEILGANGRVLTSEGKSRYLSSKLWQNLECDEIQDASDAETEEDDGMNGTTTPATSSDPLTEAFIGGRPQNLFQYHPVPEQAMILWRIHVERVEPLCKILHIPSTTRLVEVTARQPDTASKADECVLFAIYHFAVFAMTENECTAQLGLPRTFLLQKYQHAARQALVNAGFLKSTELAVLQALVLYLISSHYSYGAHTYWILTGVAVRIGQRIGLHRDGEKLGLPPFESEMQRRLFYQLLPLDGRASGAAGMGITMLPDAWDTQPPLNVNDDQIWPGMTERPQPQKGATDMLLCLSRITLGNFLCARAKPTAEKKEPTPWLFADARGAEKLVTEAESEVEEKYIRYCDVVNPLHFLAICLSRCSITAMRLRVRLNKAKSNTASDEDKRAVWQLALKILNTDAAVCANPGVQRYQWYLRHFFLWGTWDSFVFLLTTLLKDQHLFSDTEVDSAWVSVEMMYLNHAELLTSKRALYVALGRLALKAWDARSRTIPSDEGLEPEFISTLRSLRTNKDTAGNATIPKGSTEPASGPALTVFGVSTMALDVDDGFDLEAVDWEFWDRLVQDDDVRTGE